MTKTLFLSVDNFGTAMNHETGIRLSHYDTVDFGWQPSEGSMKYSHPDGKWNYRTWLPDTSLGRGGLALLVSCKIDHFSSPKDDHVVLIASFNGDKHLIAAQASVQSINQKNSAIAGTVVATLSPDCKYPDDASDAALIEAFAAEMATAVATVLGKGSDGGLTYLTEVATINLRCLLKGISLN